MKKGHGMFEHGAHKTGMKKHKGAHGGKNLVATASNVKALGGGKSGK